MFLEDKQTYITPDVNPVRDVLLKAKELYASEGFYKPNARGCAIHAVWTVDAGSNEREAASRVLCDAGLRVFPKHGLVKASDELGIKAGLACFDEALSDV